MSDRVTNVEIEDVLSSIRRLVSEAATVPGGPPAAAHAPAGKLLLTEAHRINPAPERESAEILPGQDEPVAQDTAGTADIPANDIVPDDLLTEGGIVLDLPFAFRNRVQTPVEADYSTHIQSDTLVPGNDAAPKAAADLTHPDTADAEGPVVDGPEGEQIDPGVTVEPADADVSDGIDWRSIDRGQRLADTAAGLEMATDDATGDWELDGSEDVPVMDWAAATEQAEDGPVPVFRSRKLPPLRLTPEDAVAPAAILPAPEDVAPAPLGAAVLPFDTGRARPPEDGAHGGLGHDLRGFDPQDRAATDDASDAAIMAALRDANGVNEALLRELVLEIVRQELQGALGERITRNVRKLVRREIYRVLNEAEQN